MSSGLREATGRLRYSSHHRIIASSHHRIIASSHHRIIASHKEQAMKAAVCYEFGQPLVVEEVEIAPPQAGEVKVRIGACAICHSDVHLIRGEWGGSTPVIAGHEAAGIVDEVGPGVASVQPGDHVVVSLLRNCGRCYQCQQGKPFACEATYSLDSESRLHTREGAPIIQGIRCATFAEYAVVHESQVVSVPEDLPLELASLLACGVITGLGAAVNTAQVQPGSSVAVIGCGGVGINAIQGSALAGARQIIAIDLLPNKLEAALNFGATETINAAEDPVAAVLARTGGHGVDYALIAVGSPRAIQQGFAMTRKTGTTVIVGMPSNEEVMIPLNAHHFTSGRTVTGSNMGSTRLHRDVPYLVNLYQQGRLKLDELVTRRYPLDEINEAIASMERGEALRNVIVFS
jgi:S-(hydroxymethyl)glutathione dehydrogenase / alcohol dehydrogenase